MVNDKLNSITIDGDVFKVLVNAEGQHSLWPAGLEVPKGWSEACSPRSRAECLEFVEKNWTDMRPVSLRVAMEQGN